MTVSALCLWSFLSYDMYLFIQIFSGMLTSHARIFSYKYNIVGEFQNLWGFLHIKFINAPPSQTTLKPPTNNPLPPKKTKQKQTKKTTKHFLTEIFVPSSKSLQSTQSVKHTKQFENRV